jgi:hypothetical protein
MLDKRVFLCYIVPMNNNDDEQTQRLLDAICEGINLPSEEEEQTTAELQDN